MTELSGIEGKIRNDRNCQAEKWQGWVRTLWPVAATIIALFMAYQSLESRVTVVESSIVVLQDAVRTLQDTQNQTNIQLGILNTNIDNLNGNITRIVNILDSER